MGATARGPIRMDRRDGSPLRRRERRARGNRVELQCGFSDSRRSRSLLRTRLGPKARAARRARARPRVVLCRPFVSCAPDERRGGAAHFPTIVVEILAQHGGGKFTPEKEAYLRSARLPDYYIVDATRRYVFRYSRAENADDRGRIFAAEYHRGPVTVPAFGRTISFEQTYAGTPVPAILYPIRSDDGNEAEITLD